jgi:acyl-Coa thioesterase superfamily protein/acyl-CoA thioesterase superfamily protein
MADAAVFIARAGGFLATELARGPWDPNAQHGGAPAALLMREFERLPMPDGLVMARVTYELLRPVPLGELQVQAQVARTARRTQLLEASIRDASGTELVRARALQVRHAEAAGYTTDSSPPAGPEHGQERPMPFERRLSPTFGPDAIEIRIVEGTFGAGPATAWFRLRVPLIAGEAPTPLQLLAAAADFGNGISAVLPWHDHVFINPDLTLYIERPPQGEWICLQAETRVSEGGIGLAESALYDPRGRVGRAVQALLIARR